MKNIRRYAFVTLTLLIVLAVVPVAWAHPLGNFTINHYAGLRVSRDAVTIDFVLDMAEIPAFQEITAFDTNSNGRPDPGKAASYHPAKCEALRPDLDLRLDGLPAPLTLVSSAVDFPPGAGGLLTLRLTCAFRAAFAPAASGARVELAGSLYSSRCAPSNVTHLSDPRSTPKPSWRMPRTQTPLVCV